jgi:hypothetical protein
MIKNLSQKLVTDRKAVIQRLDSAKLERYDRLCRDLRKVDVTVDARYKMAFSGFYKLRRNDEWRNHYFALLEREKHNLEIDASDVLESLYELTGQVEASFATKLVATINPNEPVYDKHVRDHLKLKVLSWGHPPDRRIQHFRSVFQQLRERIRELRHEPRVREMVVMFDEAFPQYAHFTETKKVDLLLWQLR